MIKIRNVNCEWSVCPVLPGLDFARTVTTDQPVTRQPVLRIFGSDDTGRKTCAHVHGFLPYFYVPCPSSPDAGYLKVLATSLDRAINLSSNRSTDSHKSFVFRVTPVVLKPFYGFHEAESEFLKIEFCRPQIVKRAAELLQAGVVLNHVFQPYELHVPYILRFFIDCNLYGMEYVRIKDARYRRHIDSSFVLSGVQPETSCAVELDCLVEDILNAGDLTSSEAANPGLEFIWQDERGRRGLTDISFLVPPSQDRPQLLEPESEAYFKSTLKEWLSTPPVPSPIEPEEPGVAPSPLSQSFLGSEEPMVDEAGVLELSQSLEADSNKTLLMDQILTGLDDDDEEAGPSHEIDLVPDSQPLLSSQSIEGGTPPEDQVDEEGEALQMSMRIEAEPASSDDDFDLDQLDGATRRGGKRAKTSKPKTTVKKTKTSQPSSSGQLGRALRSESITFDDYIVLSSDDEEGAAAAVLASKSRDDDRRQVATVASKRVSRQQTVSVELLEQRSTTAPERSQSQGTQNVSPHLPARVVEYDPWDLFETAGDVAFTGNRKTFTPSVAPPSRRTISEALSKHSDNTAPPRTISAGGSERGSSDTATPPMDVESSELDVLVTNVRPKHLLRNETQLEYDVGSSSFGFDTTFCDLQNVPSTMDKLHVTVSSLEVHVHVREGFVPDPVQDNICSVTMTTYDEGEGSLLIDVFVVLPSNGDATASTSDVTDSVVSRRSFPGDLKSVAGGDESPTKHDASDAVSYHLVTSEAELLLKLVDRVQALDPDFLIGYEIQLNSWGFILERGKKLGMDDLAAKLSRTPGLLKESRYTIEDDWWAMADFHVTGRIVLNLWRIMKTEVTITMYSLCNVVYHVLRRRIPRYSDWTLTKFCLSERRLHLGTTVEYLMLKSRLNIDLLLHCNILGRTAEMAKLFGIQFYDVLTRGTQYRVESMLYRMTRRQGYVAFSPSITQRNQMAAPECIALTMEPESQFYTDPIVVLDFQSLYPSVIIAYNYCYSTCLGKVKNMVESDVYPFGASQLSRPGLGTGLSLDDVTVSPAGVVFVKDNVRRGILPEMLSEILDTRIMVKKSLKTCDSSSLRKVLDSRQLGLKMIANVTYGYTSANYSGRMPCVEVADSIVHKGRETLEKAIALVQNHPDWGAQVVYGDTDSLFIRLPGRTKAEAFRLGEEMATYVTQRNPKPMKLKFEKVYYPCVLQTKKRYVGYAYETPDQTEPTFAAKGIETVRRDTCPAVSKTLEKSLRLLFEQHSADVVRDYLQRQMTLIRQGRVSLTDFIFAREYRGLKGYKPTAAVPALAIARQRLRLDPRADPRIGERVPFVIVRGAPGSTLLSCVREPVTFLSDLGLTLNYGYYIGSCILPALERALEFTGVNVRSWTEDLLPPDTKKIARPSGPGPSRQRNERLSQFFRPVNCVLCGELAIRQLCTTCASARTDSVEVTLLERIRLAELRWRAAAQICSACMGHNRSASHCKSIECPVLSKRLQVSRDLSANRVLLSCLEQFHDDLVSD